ncbi:kazal-type serine protease inhibitor domain-containing protein 1-like [Huso huso]|uniref:Kazal-type serine protease inhibitor domain-containing protein 1-like n=1 Tax=Huso huso TaxID=61971 RepID=A0ABR0YTW7_HUSHU
MSLVITLTLLLSVPLAHGAPRFYHRGWLRLLKEGDSCEECRLDLCPAAPSSCPAGVVLDECGCCKECGNVEGQICDPDGKQRFYGRCGEGLECGKDSSRTPEPQCMCLSGETVCGSDGRTYKNECRLREASYGGAANLSVKQQGPCSTVPLISRAPRDLQNYTGNDIIFGCEVSAYPMAHLGWRKKGKETFLPGDDAHISVQVRGGPQRYGITGWLQIQGVTKSDEGVYTCYTRNAYGEAYASASLQVIDQEQTNGDASIFIQELQNNSMEDSMASEMDMGPIRPQNFLFGTKPTLSY